jgi:hypothetical protein
MKTRILYSLGLFSLTVLFIGCNTTVTQVGNKYPPVAVEHIAVLYQEPEKPYEVIGLVSHTGDFLGSSVDSVTRECARLAAQLGADAVVITSTANYSWNSDPKASGKAIKYK